MHDEIDFARHYEYDVEVYVDANVVLGAGKLTFGAGAFPAVRLRTDEPFFPPEDGMDICAKVRGGYEFLLLNCRSQDYSIHAEWLVRGLRPSSVNEITVKYADISDWFLAGHDVRGVPGESLTWVHEPPSVAALVEYPTGRFAVNSQIHTSIRKYREVRSIHQYANFVFSRPNAGFSSQEIKSLPLELAALLSLLIAYPISISSLYLKNDSGNSFAAYYPTFKRPDRDFEDNAFNHNALLPRSALDGQWQKVMARYFGSPFREAFWQRLAGMQRYDGFWEYKVLGYVSLLDGFASKLTELRRIKPQSNNVGKIDQVLKELSGIAHPLSAEQLELVIPIIRSALPKPRPLYFAEKYEYLISQTDVDVLKVINLSPRDFAAIKVVRDAVAHGKTVDFQEITFEKIYGTTQKITLLMIYHALVDFGISVGVFLKGLAHSHNTLGSIKELDFIHLQRAVHPASFLQVSRETYDLVTVQPSLRVHACFIKGADGVATYSAKHTERYANWRARHISGRFPSDEIFGVASHAVRLVAHAYLECETYVKEIYGAYVIQD